MFIYECLFQSNEVNQGDVLEHDFSCMYAAVLFPITKILHQDLSQVKNSVHAYIVMLKFTWIVSVSLPTESFRMRDKNAVITWFIKFINFSSKSHLSKLCFSQQPSLCWSTGASFTAPSLASLLWWLTCKQTSRVKLSVRRSSTRWPWIWWR